MVRGLCHDSTCTTYIEVPKKYIFQIFGSFICFLHFCGMIHFVTFGDPDFVSHQKRNTERYSRAWVAALSAEEAMPLDPTDELGRGFEHLVRELCLSDEERILKKRDFPRGSSRSRLFFREVDLKWEEPAETILVEVKSCLGPGWLNNRSRGLKQVSSLRTFIGDYLSARCLLICVRERPFGDKYDFFPRRGLPSRESILRGEHINAGDLFEYGLSTGYFKDKDLLKKARDGFRYERPEKGGLYKVSETPVDTLGDLISPLLK